VGVVVDLYRVTRIQQPTSYADGATVFSTALEPSLDYLTRITQDINRDIGIVRAKTTNLAASVSAAALSAASAAASAASAAALLSSFNAVYYPPAATDPTGVIPSGALFFNTTTNTMKVYSAGTWNAVVPSTVLSVAGRTGNVTLTMADITNASANGRSLVTAADYAAMKTLLAITAADVTDSGSTGRSLLQSSTVAAVKAILGYIIDDIGSLGTNVLATLKVAVNGALGLVRLDAAGKLPAIDGSALTNLPTTGLATKPQTAAGVGQWVTLGPAAVSTAVTLPAGGTWAYFVLAYNTAGVNMTASTSGVAAGGTTVLTTNANTVAAGFAWRVA
jgi:hypothetical protein